MTCYLYILLCKDKSYYTGITWNLKKRIAEHNQRVKTPLQYSKIPVRLVYWERYDTRIEAARREKIIKGWSRDKKAMLIKNIHE